MQLKLLGLARHDDGKMLRAGSAVSLLSPCTVSEFQLSLIHLADIWPDLQQLCPSSLLYLSLV